MEYLFSQFNKVKEQLRNKFILLLLDYDGTLTPIAATPKKAVISEDVKELLQKLSKSPHCALGIISGRSLEDLKNTVGIRDIVYAGNHGLEIKGPNIKFESRVSTRLKSFIRNIAEELPKQLSNIKGVLIEDKGLTLSIHYRLVDKKDAPLFERILFEVTNPYIVRGKIKMNSGKKVYEIKPPLEWDKGKVVLWLLRKEQSISKKKRIFPIYIGDDTTDEDAFKKLREKGLTIFVGKGRSSHACYYLKDVNEVKEFLRQILNIDKDINPCQN